jgi:hypothetical protein
MPRLILLFSLVACHTAGVAPGDMTMTPDLAITLHPLGGTCATAADCQGDGVQCWTTAVNGGYPIEGGLCTTSCRSDSQCGDAMCVPLYDGSGVVHDCLSRCRQVSDCHEGLACYLYSFSVGYCYSDEYNNCDPTAGSGRCPDGEPCLRIATPNPGHDTGYCQSSCTLDQSSCPGGICVLMDTRHTVDYLGQPNGDKFAGLACMVPYRPVPDGERCYTGLDAESDKKLSEAACTPGSSCFLKTSSPNGDDLCHPMCRLGEACATGTCTDVYNLAGSDTPIGLCL